MRCRTAVTVALASALLWPATADADAVRTAKNPYADAGGLNGGVAHANSATTGTHLRLDASHTCPTVDCGLGRQNPTGDGFVQEGWVRERLPAKGSYFTVTVTATVTEYATYSARPEDAPTIALSVISNRGLPDFHDYCRGSDNDVHHDVTGTGTFTWTCTLWKPRFGDDPRHLTLDVRLNAYLSQRSSLLEPTTARASAVIDSITLGPYVSS